jgi:hypothetical protein
MPKMQSSRFTSVLLYLLVPIGAFLMGALFGYGWRLFPRTGLGILLDEVHTKIHAGMSYDEIVELLGPEEGRLSDDLLLRNLQNRFVAFEPDENYCLPNETGGTNLFWRNQNDGRAWTVVSFDRDQDVRCIFAVEIAYFVE